MHIGQWGQTVQLITYETSNGCGESQTGLVTG